MFAFGVAFIGLAVVLRLMKRKRPGQSEFAVLVGDLGLMSLCNGMYFHAAREKPNMLELVSMFLFLCLFSPVAWKLLFRCLPGMRKCFRGFRRVVWIGTALVFATGVASAFIKRSWIIPYDLAYGWIFCTFFAIAIDWWRWLRVAEKPVPGVRTIVWLLVADVGITAVMLVAQLTGNTDGMMGLWILLASSAFVSFFIAIRQQREATAALAPAARGHYEHSKLENIQVEDAIARLEEAMRREQLFRDPDLRLGDLAKRVGINNSQLSELINLRVGMSFSEYVNGFRVEKARKELVEKAGKAIIEIGFDCGFNSKSSFNSVFRKAAGMSPREFRAQKRPET